MLIIILELSNFHIYNRFRQLETGGPILTHLSWHNEFLFHFSGFDEQLSLSALHPPKQRTKESYHPAPPAISQENDSKGGQLSVHRHNGIISGKGSHVIPGITGRVWFGTTLYNRR